MNAVTKGIHHLGLTVPDIDDAVAFFCEVLGFEKVGEKPEYPAIFVHDGTVMLTLWQAQTDNPVAFNRKTNVGLHHFALAVADSAALQAIHTRLQQYEGADIEFAPEPLNGTSFQHMMCIIPGGIRMEFFALGGQ